MNKEERRFARLERMLLAMAEAMIQDEMHPTSYDDRFWQDLLDLRSESDLDRPEPDHKM